MVTRFPDSFVRSIQQSLHALAMSARIVFADVHPSGGSERVSQIVAFTRHLLGAVWGGLRKECKLGRPCSTVGIITRAPTGDSARVQMSPCIGVKPNMPASDRYVDFYSRVFVWASSTLRSALPFPSSQLSGPTTHYVLLFLRFRITHHTVCEEYEPSRLGSVYHEDAFCPGHYSVPYSWRYETRRTTEIEWQLYACASRRFYVCC